ncbi:AI-2E family transporter [Szabonella alba]|uniref:AI-2E family transporter n=1 Tax=Szabonella alba TaxID=2804194 RepID=A0A8K0XZI3_9RHOB|nr:AI-2E family transporter [Szabonella alba]MBL4916831.1 AI-2E family transporter [Szabonella alba]
MRLDTETSETLPGGRPAGAAVQPAASGRPVISGPTPLRPLARGRYSLQTWFLGIIAFGVILVVLVQARFILTSLIFAIMLFSLTTDVIGSISRLRIGSWRITNWLASLVAFALIAAFLLTLAGFILSQVNTVVTNAVAFTDQAISAIAGLFAYMGPDTEAAVAASIRSVDLSGYLRAAAGQAGNLLSATTLVILFVGFLFGERLWFNTKLEKLMGDPVSAQRVRLIINSIIRRVNRYLVVKTGVSTVTGLAVYAIMMGFGLEFAVSMAILTFVLNYIPSIGSIIATLIVVLVGYLQVPEPGFALLLLVLVSSTQFLLGSVIDPMLMGRTLRISAFGIIISLAFWSLVWGVPGAFLAVPVLVATMIVCTHIPAARPVAILISRDGLPEFDEDREAQETAAQAKAAAAAEKARATPPKARTGT